MSTRKHLKHITEPLPTPADSNARTGIIFFSVSVLMHGLFFGGLIYFQDFRLPKPMPPVIQIDLVSFSPEPVLEEPAKIKNAEDSKQDSVSTKIPSIKNAPQKIHSIKPDISLKQKPKNLKDLMADQEEKKKAPKEKVAKTEEKKPIEQSQKESEPDTAPEKAKDQPEKKAADPTQDKIAQALSRLQQKVKEQGKTQKDGGAYANLGKKGYKPIDLYKMVLGSAIEQNWVFNDILAKMDQDLEVRILIKILKNGEIRDIIYETKSGNRYLDESAKKAIKKSNPLPQLPVGMHSYDVVVIFTPKGLK